MLNSEESNDKYISEKDAYVLLYMFALLDEYDKSDDPNKQLRDPYRQQISVPTKNGAYIKVPDYIQKYAIYKWIESKGKIHEKPPCNKSFVNNVFQLIVCLLIVFIFIYLLSRFRKGISKFSNNYDIVLFK